MKKIFSLILATLLLTGCAHRPSPAETTSPPEFLLAEAFYPEMAPYPNETEFIDPKTGIFDHEGFSVVYDAWRSNRDLRKNIPEGYADSLSFYFQSTIPVFLSGAEGNAVCSPLNIYMALALLAECTDGNSRQQIMNLLDCADMAVLRTQAGQVWKAHYCADGASACTLANSLWLDSGLTCNPDTISRLANDYYTFVFQGALGSGEADRALQDWLNDQTDGLLSEQADNLRMDPQTVLALASTIYYRAKWNSEFSPEQNTENTFHTPGGDLTTTFMNKQLTYGPYYWGDDFGAVSLSLEDGSKMWLILPDEGLTPEDLLASRNAAKLALGGWLETDAQKSLRVNLSLPKFDVGSDLHLEEAIQSLGITAVFDPETADFSPILPEQAAWLDVVNHAARVKIDEEGVEAAAYTVMMAAGAAMPPEDEMDFILDRPFLFFITSRDNLPLFAGIVNEP